MISQAAFPPLPETRYPGQHLLRFRSNRALYLESLAREHGDLVRLPFPGQPVFLLSDPEVIRDVLESGHRDYVKGRGLENAALLLGNGLLTSEGETHAAQRKLVMPAFHRARILAYGSDMVRSSLALSDGWREGEQVDVAHEMMCLTREIVARALFDYDIGPDSDDIDAALTEAVDSFGRPGALSLPVWMVERGWMPGGRRLRKAIQELDSFVYRMIRERRADPRDRGDLLSMLLGASSKADHPQIDPLSRDDAAQSPDVETELDGEGLDDVAIRDEVMTLLLAGHETTANALAWTWHLLAEHPEVEARLHEELREVLGGRPPSVDDMDDLVYTRQVLQEAMRLYPPAWILGRRALRDVELGGYGIPGGSLILMSQWVVHRDARWYRDPDRFKPERWAPPSPDRPVPSKPKYAYFPFGGGPRRCIGEAFAWLEGVLVLATLAQDWQLSAVPGHAVEVDPLITLRPKQGIRMCLTSRRPKFDLPSRALSMDESA